MVAEDGQTELYLKFKLLDQNVLLPIENISVVLAIPQIQPMPNASAAFVGVINFHGESVSVYDLVKLLNNSKTLKIDADTPLLVCKIHEQNIGFLISEMNDLVEISQNVLQPKLEGMMSFVVSIYKEGADLWWVLSVDDLIKENMLLLSTKEKL